MAQSSAGKKQFAHPTVLVVRHGSTEFNEGPGGGRLKGTKYDLSLDSKGRDEAAADAEKLSKSDIASLETSPAKRAQETAGVIGKALGQNPKTNDGLRPWDVGYLSGQKRTEAAGRVAYYINHPSRRVPDGESYGNWFDDFSNTLEKKMNQAKKTPGQAHVIVTHSTGNRAAPAVINGTRPEPHTGQMPSPGRITAIEKRGGRWQINENPDL